MQIRFPWFTPQSFFPKLSHNHHQATKESSKQETKTLYNWKPFNRFRLGETPKKTLRFFLLAAATHTTIQTLKWVCNPKSSEVEHKNRGLGSSWPEQDTKTPSQHKVRASELLRKKFKKTQKSTNFFLWSPKTGVKGTQRPRGQRQIQNQIAAKQYKKSPSWGRGSVVSRH